MGETEKNESVLFPMRSITVYERGRMGELILEGQEFRGLGWYKVTGGFLLVSDGEGSELEVDVWSADPRVGLGATISLPERTPVPLPEPIRRHWRSILESIPVLNDWGRKPPAQGRRPLADMSALAWPPSEAPEYVDKQQFCASSWSGGDGHFHFGDYTVILHDRDLALVKAALERGVRPPGGTALLQLEGDLIEVSLV